MDTNHTRVLWEKDIIRFRSKFSLSPQVSYKPLKDAFSKE